MMRRRLLTALLLAGFCAAALPGCIKARAQTPAPPPPALNVPDAPGRLNIPVNPDPVPPPEPPPMPASDKPVTAPPVQKPRPTPTPAAPPPAQPPAVDPPPAPVRLAQSGTEDRARERLTVAVREIAKVKKEALPGAAREQYDSAERFIRMAKSALSVKNFVYAFYCADKAATLAELLVKRL